MQLILEQMLKKCLRKDHVNLWGEAVDFDGFSEVGSSADRNLAFDNNCRPSRQQFFRVWLSQYQICITQLSLCHLYIMFIVCFVYYLANESYSKQAFKEVDRESLGFFLFLVGGKQHEGKLPPPTLTKQEQIDWKDTCAYYIYKIIIFVGIIFYFWSIS